MKKILFTVGKENMGIISKAILSPNARILGNFFTFPIFSHGLSLGISISEHAS